MVGALVLPVCGSVMVGILSRRFLSRRTGRQPKRNGQRSRVWNWRRPRNTNNVVNSSMAPVEASQ